MMTIILILLVYLTLKLFLVVYYDFVVSDALSQLGIKNPYDMMYSGILFNNTLSGLNPFNWSINSMATDYQVKALRIHKNKIYLDKKNGKSKRVRDKIINSLADKRF